MLTFRFSGVDGCMTETETLTSGMVGKEIKLELSNDWDNMTKTAVFIAGDVTRDVVGISDTVEIPAAVLAQPLQRLYVGIYGVKDDGRVTPTIRAEGPWIVPGADPSGDEGTAPDLPVWAQLQTQIDALKNSGSGNESGDHVTNADVGSIKVVLGNIMTILKAQVEDESGTPQGYGMDVSGLVTHNEALIAALGSAGDGEEADTPVTPGKTLTGISAVYNGGAVTAGTAVSALVGITVTAHYADGTSETVTGYTLSGSIAEGENTITVSYGGKSATFSVSGIAQSAEEEEILLRTSEYGFNVTMYSDSGSTSVGDDGNCYCDQSDEVFAEETEVAISFNLTGTIGTRKAYAGCVTEDIDITLNPQPTTAFSAYHVALLGTLNNVQNVKYTVKAGYKLILIQVGGNRQGAFTAAKEV